jgi:hypothetical protein
MRWQHIYIGYDEPKMVGYGMVRRDGDGSMFHYMIPTDVAGRSSKMSSYTRPRHGHRSDDERIT